LIASILAWAARLKGPLVAVAGVGAVLSGLVGYYTTYKTVATIAPVASPAPAAVPEHALSIVVLPFANQTGDPQKAYIADALTTSMTGDLSRIRDAFVVPYATARAYKDKATNVRDVGREIGVRFVLQGAVLASADKIRIGAELSDTQTGAQLWADTFEGQLTDLFALEDQVTARIGNSIGRQMVILAARESESRKTTPKVADLLLRARAAALKPQGVEDLLAIEALYRQAVALQPNNVMALTGLANAILMAASNFQYPADRKARDKRYEEGKALALRAKQLDPDDPMIYTALQVHASYKDDLPGAMRAAQTRLSLEPKHPGAYVNLAVAEMDLGEASSAIEHLTQAMNLDPKRANAALFMNMGNSYFMKGDNDATILWMLRALEANPALTNANAYLAMAYKLKGDDAKSRAAAAMLGSGVRLTDIERPRPNAPPAFRDYYENRYLAAGRLAGLPE
jgi:adenylate cyclase